jgi:hypothetical protein
MLRNIFLENEYRYLFVSQFKPKIIFNFKKNTIFDYSGSKLLLENGASQIISCNEINSVRRYSSRKISENQSIDFKLLNNKINLKNENIDTILSFESIESKYFFNKIINEFYPILSKNGIFILSVFNSECIKTSSNEKKGLTKKELEDILKQKFENVTIYSQKFLTKKEIKEINSSLTLFSEELSVIHTKNISLIKKIRNICANIFQYFDKTNTIYVKYLQKTILKIDMTVDEKIEKSKYMPVLLDSDDVPLFYIAVCKK